MRIFLLVLLLANIILGVFLYLRETGPAAPLSQASELNADKIKIVGPPPPGMPGDQPALAVAGTPQSTPLGHDQCLEWSGVQVADATRAREVLAGLQLVPRVTQRLVERVSRYWVYLPPLAGPKQGEKKVAELKELGLNDVALMADYSVSLGMFSSEEAAKRFLSELEGRGVREAKASVRGKPGKEIIYTVRDPQPDSMEKLNASLPGFPGSQVNTVTCPKNGNGKQK